MMSPLPGGFIRDIQYAARLIARDRWFTAAAVLALALGLGVSSTILTVIYSMNLRALPFQDPWRIMAVGGESTRTQGGRIPSAVFDAWGSSSTSFSGMAAHLDAVANLGDDTRATDQFRGTFVSHNAFAVLGVRPMLGRDFRRKTIAWVRRRS